MNFNHLIYNAHNLLSAAPIKDLVGSSIAWALLPKRFRIPSVCDPYIPWWHHAQCGSLQHMVRHASTLACLYNEQLLFAHTWQRISRAYFG